MKKIDRVSHLRRARETAMTAMHRPTRRGPLSAGVSGAWYTEFHA
jgi:hypothetical protein